jgi:hypothetical protein
VAVLFAIFQVDVPLSLSLFTPVNVAVAACAPTATPIRADIANTLRIFSLRVF